MTYPKLKPRVVALLALVVAVVVGLVAFKSSPKNSPQTTTPSSQSNTQTPANTRGQPAAKIDTSDFSYQQPVNWAALPQAKLTASEATSGIVHSYAPVSTFMIKVSSSVPKNDADLKSSTLKELEKFTGFVQLGITPTQVNGKSGQKFTYTFSSTDKTRQEMSVIIYKQKTFFLLFTATDADFSKASPDFAQILASFKFK